MIEGIICRLPARRRLRPPGSSLVGKDQRYMLVYEHLPPIIKRRSRKMRETYAQLWHDLLAGGVASGL